MCFQIYFDLNKMIKPFTSYNDLLFNTNHRFIPLGNKVVFGYDKHKNIRQSSV